MRFVVVYQREPHARQLAFRDVPQPKDFAERAALARKALKELKLDVDVWIDDDGDQSRALFGDLPHSAIVLDRVGTVQVKLSWCDPTVLAQLIPEVPEMSPGKTMAPVENHFETRVAAARPDDADEQVWRFHRDVMLAWLVANKPAHELRGAWLEELAGRGPAHQQAWVQRQQRTDDGR
ncbi:MAG: hypothetical protein KAI24_17730 [Planctomycetes bacterium]|nr:hypothetical protein [Planctomycetota bacterium]